MSVLVAHESVLVRVAHDCNPAIGGLGHPHLRPQSSVHTMHRDAGPLCGAGPVGIWAVSGALGWQALLSTGSSGLRLGISAWT